MPTPALEEYLEAIYKLSPEGAVRPTRIAEVVGVAGPTVTATLKRLESHGLVVREGTGVVLTAEGVTRSLEIVRKHRIAERFLVDTLGLDWEAAHEDACLLEHALSPRVLEALERFLGDPTVCPHGHPIPSADGVVAGTAGSSLDGVSVGRAVQVVRVAENEELLGYLGSIGMRPGAIVEVISVEPMGGPMMVSIDGTERPLSREVAAFVTVSESVA